MYFLNYILKQNFWQFFDTYMYKKETHKQTLHDFAF